MEEDMRAVESASDVSYLIARYKSARRKDQKDILNAVSKRLKELGVGRIGRSKVFWCLVLPRNEY